MSRYNKSGCARFFCDLCNYAVFNKDFLRFEKLCLTGSRFKAGYHFELIVTHSLKKSKTKDRSGHKSKYNSLMTGS